MWRALTLLCAAALTWLPLSRGADWPCYGADPQRSFTTDDALTLPLAPAWSYNPVQPPRPAWPDPGKELHRIDFDFAFQPIVAGGLVIFGSSGDGAVRALSLTDGALRWRFVTGGAVRFAPHAWQGRVYVASDDGHLYCLALDSGELIWEKRLAPGSDLVIGNEQLTSRWPLRSGVTIADGVLYTSAGMWPSEGVLIFALDPADGRELWRNDTCGRIYSDFPHSTYAIAGVVPQGYPAVGEKTIAFACGRAQPAGFDRATGQLLYVNQEARKRWPDGGSRLIVAGPFMFNGCTFGTLVHVKANPREADPVEYEGTKAYFVDTGRTASQRFLPIQKYSTNSFYRILAGRDRIFTVSSLGWLNATLMTDPANAKLSRRLWNVPFDGVRIYEMAWAGQHLLLGDRGRLLIHDAETGARLAELPLDGNARGLAVSGGRLLVALQDGRIICYAGDAPGSMTVHDERASRVDRVPASLPAPLAPLGEALSQTGPTAGFAIVDGLPDTVTAHALAGRHGLRTIQFAAEPDRRRAAELPDLGGAVTFLAPERLADLPAWFANAIVARDADAPRLQLLYRALHPYTGLMLLTGAVDSNLLDRAGIPAVEREAVAGGTLIRRGAPPEEELVVKPPFRMVWFGGPGPNRMSDRHITDAPRPQASHGRYFVVGEHWLLGVDAFNGVEQWCVPMYNACLRDAYSYATAVSMNAAAEAVRVRLEHGPQLDLDPRTGRLLRYYGLPTATERFALRGPRTFAMTPVDPAGAERRQVSGELLIAPAAAALEVTFTLTDPVESLYDRIELCFDFRPPAERFGLYGPGAFHFTVHPPTHYDRTTISKFFLEYPRRIMLVPRPEKDEVFERTPYLVAGAGPAHPAHTLDGRWEDGHRRVVTLRLPWSEIARVAGHDGREFAFAAFARASDNQVDQANKQPFVALGFHGNEDIVRLNNGWPVFSPEAEADGPLPPPAGSPLLASLEAMPPLPPNVPPSDDTAAETVSAERHHPLSGAATPRNFRPAYGCATPISEGSTSYFRSATIAYYDFANDSGVHVIPGVRPGCRDNSGILPAQGRLIYSERSSGCSCAYNLQTSLAMAPTDRGSHEDWGIFYDEPNLDELAMASLNLAAPGDQRDADGDLWLGLPRPWNHERPSLFVPAQWTADTGDGLGEFRFNADLHPIHGTDRPWVYTSGIRGLRELTVDLRRGANVVALRTASPIDLDGRLDEAAWNQDDVPERVLLRMPAMVYDREYWDKYRAGEGYSDWAAVRYDDTHLYLAFYDTAKVSRRGVVQTWRGQAKDLDDPAIHGDNRYEAFLSDHRRQTMVHLAVSASGARYDARCADPAATAEDPGWNGNWQAAARTDEAGFIVEMAIPWQTLEEAGLDANRLDVNLGSVSQTPFRDRFLRYPGRFGRSRCTEFVPLGRDLPRPTPARTFTVKLHFAEPDPAVLPGQRVFTVKLQGQTVLDRLDIRAETGAIDTALVREFRGIAATDELRLELIPAAPEAAAATTTLLNGLQLRDEALVLPVLAGEIPPPQP